MKPALKIQNEGRCFRAGCDAPGVFQPVLLVWAKGWGRGTHPPIEIEMGFYVCKPHKRETRVEELVTLEAKTLIGDVCSRLKRAEPDMDSVDLMFKRVRS
jgi:hypothetical protein